MNHVLSLFDMTLFLQIWTGTKEPEPEAIDLLSATQICIPLHQGGGKLPSWAMTGKGVGADCGRWDRAVCGPLHSEWRGGGTDPETTRQNGSGIQGSSLAKPPGS